MQSVITVMCSLFTTCTYKCGYCALAETGSVLDTMQLRPYRDIEFIHRITEFFIARTDSSRKWHLQLTGGEPLLMPNFDLFCDRLFASGNKVSIYTALFPGDSHPAFRYLLTHDRKDFDYLMVSFHPEAEPHEKDFFDKIHLLKESGHDVIVRFVAHPQRLGLINRLEQQCRELDVTFYINSLITTTYPQAYTTEEKRIVASRMSSFSQHVMLEGGIDTTEVLCRAGMRNIAVDFLSGNITPCVHLAAPVLGNLHTNELKLYTKPEVCAKAGMDCNCDVHFNEELPVGLQGREIWERQKKAYVPPLSASEVHESKQKFEAAGFQFAHATGFRFPPSSVITGPTDDDSPLVLSREQVKERYEEWKRRHY